jgi:hypothetical protein
MLAMTTPPRTCSTSRPSGRAPTAAGRSYYVHCNTVGGICQYTVRQRRRRPVPSAPSGTTRQERAAGQCSLVNRHGSRPEANATGQPPTHPVSCRVVRPVRRTASDGTISPLMLDRGWPGRRSSLKGEKPSVSYQRYAPRYGCSLTRNETVRIHSSDASPYGPPSVTRCAAGEPAGWLVSSQVWSAMGPTHRLHAPSRQRHVAH